MKKTLVTMLLGVAFAAPVVAQQTPPPGPQPLAVGTMAPDFALTGATRYGVLKTPIRLSDFRDKTVVIAFFYQARTRG
ncbi:MAG TPA: hypothetical protein VMH88_12925 [Gemmatimonadales bacterium]|nr:hypothetical protein [Gemmatimonadales bacterium]